MISLFAVQDVEVEPHLRGLVPQHVLDGLRQGSGKIIIFEKDFKITKNLYLAQIKIHLKLGQSNMNS
jgi:hypothetical protein